MTYVRNNISASTAGRFLAGTQNKQQKTLQKLASGYAINSAADDAAGLSISEKMRMYITGLNIGSRNISDGSSLCQTADGTLEEVHSMLNRMYELSEQAANGIYDEGDREKINQEIATLKEEIGRIGSTANFNGIRLFPPYYEFQVDGAIEDLEIFNATYDSANHIATYGGISFKGERFEWPAISPDMIDQNGEFVAGTYELVTGSGNFTLICEDGLALPQITRQFSISADVNGLIVNGDTVPWGNLHNAEGHAFNPGNIQPDSYYFDYYGSSLRLDMFGDAESLDSVISEINKHSGYNMVWTSSQVGSIHSEAVDITKFGQNNSIIVQMKNSMIAQLQGEKFPLEIKADADGIWVVDHANTTVGTKMTWQDLGINSWTSGSDISQNKTYHYKDTTGDFKVEFDFTLINETSKDSVIQGLNGVQLSFAQDGTNNKTELELQTPPGQIMSGSLTYHDVLTISELIALGRDFDVQTENLATASLKYDDATKEWNLLIKDNLGATVFDYKGSSTPAEAIVKNYATAYSAMIETLAKKAALSGSQIYVDFSDLVGAGNITGSGHLSEVITIPTPSVPPAATDPVFSTGTGGYPPPIPGTTYPAAFIDFKGFPADYSLADLSGLGFDSTCKTCSNHYSVVFVDSLQAGTAQTTPEGYEYSMKRTGNDYLLQVDINSFKQSTPPIATGEDLNKAILTVLDAGGLDEHYTQYMSDGTKLYILDDRPSSTAAPSATFYTHPFNMPPGECSLKVNIATGPPVGNKLDLEYKYSIKDIKNMISATLTVDNANGTYIKLPDNTYIPYDPADPAHQGKDKYRMDVTTLDVDAYVKKAMKEIADKSTISMDATGYETLKTTGGDELFNEAIETVFDSDISQDKPNLWIQASAIKDDGLYIDLPSMNLTVLGIKLINSLTQESALESLNKIYGAINKISSIRGSFGAYDNRLDVMQSNNENQAENLQAAESRIRDADMSKELMAHVKHQILIQSSQAMLAQANTLPQAVLSLLK